MIRTRPEAQHHQQSSSRLGSPCTTPVLQFWAMKASTIAADLPTAVAPCCTQSDLEAASAVPGDATVGAHRPCGVAEWWIDVAVITEDFISLESVFGRMG